MEVFDEVEKLYAWVDEIPLSRCKKNLSRDFSDGVLMAELCKYYFPKVVDLHNYPAANSHAAKVINWETLNRKVTAGRTKVFSKLQIKVTGDLIHQIAAGIPGALESVLLAIKNKVEEQSRKKAKSRQSKTSWGDFDDSSTCETEADIISEIKKLKKEVQLKNETISILNQKVTHLESLLEMKDKRLRELSANVDRLQAREDESQESFRTISA